MRIAILHNLVDAGGSVDEQDVLVQVEAVSTALKNLGHECYGIPCTLGLAGIRLKLENSKPDMVFNLVESLEGHGQLLHLVPALLDAMGIAYAGSPTEALFLTSNKLLAKRLLAAHGLPTAPWIEIRDHEIDVRGPVDPTRPLIVKSVWEHASIGIDEEALLSDTSANQVCGILMERAPEMGGACFAEAFIEGREFNVSVLAGPEGPEVLPLAEIDFKDYPDGKLKIVGYRAKWDEESFEYNHTPRRFDFPDQDRPLLGELKSLALQCWRLFDLAGWARVDFRVDPFNRPHILEINANPCISPDAGFAAAVAKAGLSYENAIERILDDALHGGNRRPAGTANPFVDQLRSSPRPCSELTFEYSPLPEDHDNVARIVKKTGFFSPDEEAIAVELVDDRLTKGSQSPYLFLIARIDGKMIGYTCFGPIAATLSSWDLYWIVVDPNYQNRGYGLDLIVETEKQIFQQGGRSVYVETSERRQYAATRAFYQSCGYRMITLMDDFYAPGDGKVVLRKTLH